MINQTAVANGLSALDGVQWRCLMKDYANWRGSRSGNRKYHKLEDAYTNEIGEIQQQHRALDDCRMSLALMRVVAARDNEEVSESRS